MPYNNHRMAQRVNRWAQRVDWSEMAFIIFFFIVVFNFHRYCLHDDEYFWSNFIHFTQCKLPALFLFHGEIPFSVTFEFWKEIKWDSKQSFQPNSMWLLLFICRRNIQIIFEAVLYTRDCIPIACTMRSIIMIRFMLGPWLGCIMHHISSKATNFYYDTCQAAMWKSDLVVFNV